MITFHSADNAVSRAVIGIVHMRFRAAWKAQGHTLDELPFKAMLYPYGTIFVIALNIFLVFVSGFEAFVDGFHVVSPASLTLPTVS